MGRQCSLVYREESQGKGADGNGEDPLPALRRGPSGLVRRAEDSPADQYRGGDAKEGPSEDVEHKVGALVEPGHAGRERQQIEEGGGGREDLSEGSRQSEGGAGVPRGEAVAPAGDGARQTEGEFKEVCREPCEDNREEGGHPGLSHPAIPGEHPVREEREPDHGIDDPVPQIDEHGHGSLQGVRREHGTSQDDQIQGNAGPAAHRPGTRVRVNPLPAGPLP